MDAATLPERQSTIVPPEDAGGVQPLYGHEGALLEALRRGEAGVFSELVARHAPAMRRLARSLVRDPDAADEAVQETWAALLAGLRRFQGRSSLKTWLFRVLYKRCLTKRARERRSVPFSALDGSEETPGFEASVADPRTEGRSEGLERVLARELRERITSALATLPPAQRRVLELRDLEGIASDEVCRALRVSECNQRVLLHRARVRVRAALRDYLDAPATRRRAA